MAKVLVTGAAGFIGSHVTRQLLEQGRDVRAMVRPGEDTRNLQGLGVEQVEGDILKPEQIADAMSGCDTLYHLAAIYAIWMQDDQPIYDVNVGGSQTVLEAARRHNLKKIVYTSSIAGIGLGTRNQPANEKTPWNYGWIANAYIKSKYAGQLVALRFARQGLPVVVVNPAFPFGDQDVAPTPTGQIMLNVLEGDIPGYIDGGINIIDVRDVAAGHLLAEQRGRVGETYILGHRNLTIHEFYQLVGRVSGIKVPDRRMPKALAAGVAYLYEAVSDRITHKAPPFTFKSVLCSSRYMYYDPSKAVSELGLQLHPIEEAVERAIDWFQTHGYVTNKEVGKARKLPTGT